MNSLWIAAGIYISTKIINLITDKLSEAELRKQEEIKQEIERIQEKIKSSESDEPSYQENNGELQTKKHKEIYDMLIKQAIERETDNKILFAEICETIKKVKLVLNAKDVVHTPLRKHSLELLYRQLSEAQEKCRAYSIYLKQYKEKIESINENESMPVFWMKLPPAYPYVGNLIWFTNNQLEQNHTLIYQLSPTYQVTVHISDIAEFDLQDNQPFPIMITHIVITHSSYSFHASIEKGLFKANELGNTHLGLSAKVKQINRNSVVLVYRKNLELFLPRKNLIKSSRFPPVRSTVTVYPVYWDYRLYPTSPDSIGKTKYPVLVSEKREDASSSLSFQNFPICFTKDSFQIFSQFYKEISSQNNDEEFLIGPADENNIHLRKGVQLRLQIGNIPLCILVVNEHLDNDNIDQFKFYFEFDRLCNPSEKTFSADDIFMPFDASIIPYFTGTSEKTLIKYSGISSMGDVSTAIWDIFEEFRIQDRIKRDREGIGYFYKWEMITNQLISILEQSEPFLLKISWLPAEKRNCVIAIIENDGQLKRFIQHFTKEMDRKILSEWKPEFFVKDEQGNHYEASIMDGGKRIKIQGWNVLDLFHEKTDQIELYATNCPYAEYQQRNAIKQFRSGQVVNPAIQAACLNGSSIKSNINHDCKLAPFFNNSLYSNPSQCEAIEKGIREKNLFLIQGPPGSGKTTVIREIIEQVFTANHNARILVVSQANVAVDTALEELIDQYGDQIVRCGNGNKISPKFQKMRLQHRCQEYLETLEQRKEAFDNEFYNSWEKSLISSETNKYSPVLNELIIRSHQLIGATCVGLAKRNIGLERTEFDLVIIDEAGKALPAELLIPLIRAKKAIIIGDQKQLPPVINPILYDSEKIELEERAVSENELFAHSFFERLYNSAPDSNKIMLNTQFRMPAIIGDAISQLFYDGKLKNGVGTEKREPILFDSNLVFLNFEFVKGYIEKKNGERLTNSKEAEAVVALIKSIRQKDPLCKSKIAVITPYKGQKWEICNKLYQNKIYYQTHGIMVDTVDSFQGSQAEIVIFCCTRAHKATPFFKDNRRLNVALSRARQELIILGKMSYFYKPYYKSESILPQLADYIKERGKIIASGTCQYLQCSIDNLVQEEMIFIPLDELSLPDRFYLEEINANEVSKKIDEYYENGHFIKPFVVKKSREKYILVDDFAQYVAAQEMSLSECTCSLQK